MRGALWGLRRPGPKPPYESGLRWRAVAASGSAKTDREALAALYNATDGENWDGSANWLSDAPLGRWKGVTTNVDGRVTELTLETGEIPPELGSLNNLTELFLGT